MTEQGSTLQQMIANNVAGTKRGASKHTKRCLKLNGFAWKECIPQMKMPSQRKTTFTTPGANFFPTNPLIQFRSTADCAWMIQAFLRIKLPASWHQIRFTFEPNSALQVPMRAGCCSFPCLPPPRIPYPPHKTLSQTPNQKKTKCTNTFRQRPRNHPDIYIYIYSKLPKAQVPCFRTKDAYRK
jgi:hypothetical protein